jgi:CheY-like chemotaxis protein
VGFIHIGGVGNMKAKEDKKVQILLVDDQQDFSETISFWMKSKGFEVTVAHDGEEALQRVRTSNFDIAFLDIHMPKMDGVETLAQIRKFKKRLPVILITAYPDEDTIEKAKKLKISGYFPKSGAFDDLTHMIDVALRTHKRLHF